MDFKDQIAQLAARVEKMIRQIQTELILFFINLKINVDEYNFE